MERLFRISPHVATALHTAIWVLVLLWAAQSAFKGQYSVRRLVDLRQEMAILQPQVAVQREALARAAHRVGLLSTDSIDPDLLEEEVRSSLGFAYADEIIVPLAARSE